MFNNCCFKSTLSCLQGLLDFEVYRNPSKKEALELLEKVSKSFLVSQMLLRGASFNIFLIYLLIKHTNRKFNLGPEDKTSI